MVITFTFAVLSLASTYTFITGWVLVFYVTFHSSYVVCRRDGSKSSFLEVNVGSVQSIISFQENL